MADRIKRIFGMRDRHIVDDSITEDSHETVEQVADSMERNVNRLPEEEQSLYEELSKEEFGEQESYIQEPLESYAPLELLDPTQILQKDPVLDVLPEPEEPPLPNPLDTKPTEDILHLLRDKVDEFRLLGYGAVTIDDLWSYFCGQKKRRPTNLHELVNAVLCLQPQQFMNYTMQEIYRHPFVLDGQVHLDNV